MNLKGRVQKLEIKSMPGNGVTVISLEKGETNDQALNRYCAKNEITVEDLKRQSELTVFLRTHFGD